MNIRKMLGQMSRIEQTPWKLIQYKRNPPTPQGKTFTNVCKTLNQIKYL